MRYNRRSTEIITSAASYPVTLTELKNYMRVDGSSDDDMLNGFIAAATAQLEQYCGRKFINTTVALHMDGFNSVNDEKMVSLGAGVHDAWIGDYIGGGSDKINLPFRPVQSVTSFKTYDSDNTEATFSSSAYRLDVNGSAIYLNSGYSWPTALRDNDAVLITYVAGYGATAAAVPAPIKQAILMSAGQMYSCRGSCDLSDACKAIVSGYKILDRLGWC